MRQELGEKTVENRIYGSFEYKLILVRIEEVGSDGVDSTPHKSAIFKVVDPWGSESEEIRLSPEEERLFDVNFYANIGNADSNQGPN